MQNMIIQEYIDLLQTKSTLTNTLQILPTGYISKKTIKGKQYHYLQNRVNGKVVSKYIKTEEVEALTWHLKTSKESIAKLKEIEKRLIELEQIGKLYSKSTRKNMILLKLSAGMDELSQDKKSTSISFAKTMNAIEGVPPSTQTQKQVDAWYNGEQSFLAVYQDTLEKYGFNWEV